MNAELLPRRYRTRVNKTFTLFWSLGALVGLFLLKTWTAETFSFSFQLWATIVTVAGFVFILGTVPRGFTHIDENGISRRSAFRIRRLGWADVYDIRTISMPSSAIRRYGRVQPDAVYAYRTDGKRFLLTFLNAEELGEENFPREMEVLHSLLQERRGGDWTPDPRVEEHIAEQAERYEERTNALTSWGLASVLLIAVTTVIIIQMITI
ncbi:hypothetical protein AB0P15_37325 [Streptomyces sp. NPDC087917]|uniref:hypothetical protein n=1 Tax=Streptomyces sp. NPDC087917 TaxID=3155060 RepID=UPI00342DF02F